MKSNTLEIPPDDVTVTVEFNERAEKTNRKNMKRKRSR